MIRVFNSIADKLATAYPNSPIYFQKVPQQFERPSFFVQYVAGNVDELNRRWRMDNMTFQVVFFSDLNDYDFADIDKQIGEVEKIKQLFKEGFLPIVGTNRKAKITGLRIYFREGEVYLDIDLYLNEFNPLAEEQYDTMGGLIYNQQSK